MKAREALVVLERALETGFCVSLRGFAECVGVVPSTIINWKNNPEKELRGIEATKVQYVREEVEKFEPEFVDWPAFRREAAKDLLPLATQMKDYRGFPEECVSLAIQLADELIKQIKEK